MSAHSLDERWTSRAACRGPHAVLFFAPLTPESRPERERREAQAKAICAGCEVRRECLADALRLHETHGIWGGLNEAERVALLEPGAR